MCWICKSEKWVDDKKTPGVSVTQPNQQTQEAAGLIMAPTTVVPATDYQCKSARDAALSNASHDINLALRNFTIVFNE